MNDTIQRTTRRCGRVTTHRRLEAANSLLLAEIQFATPRGEDKYTNLYAHRLKPDRHDNYGRPTWEICTSDGTVISQRHHSLDDAFRWIEHTWGDTEHVVVIDSIQECVDQQS